MNLPKRKPTRLKRYDYSTPRAYFVTICTHNWKCLFSNIVGAIHELPENKITQYGEFAKQIIEILPDRFNVSIPKYVIMPNHIHLIIEIYNSDEKRAIRESPLQHHRSVVDKVVGFLKMNVSKKNHNTNSNKIWQRSYHDHIIRGEKDYQKIWEYIDTNVVVKWKKIVSITIKGFRNLAKAFLYFLRVHSKSLCLFLYMFSDTAAYSVLPACPSKCFAFRYRTAQLFAKKHATSIFFLTQKPS